MSLRVVERDGIDGKVAASKVLKQGSAKLHFVRTALVGIGGLGAVGSYLNNSEARILRTSLHADGSVVIFIKRIRKYGLDLRRCRICGDVPVLWLAPDDKVAHASADKIRFKSCFSQTI